MKAYWFEPKEGVLGYQDGRKPEVGVTHKVDGYIVLCERGLHASVRAIDALKYAQSNIVWEVELGGDIIVGEGKCVATERTYLRRIDATDILFQCACRFALSVAHFWDMPPLVREFLETGNPKLRAAAKDAANAAWAAANAAMDAAKDAAARAAAWAAASAAAASDAAGAAAGAAAASDAAWAATRAARDAAADAQNNLLEQLLKEAK